MRDVVRVIRMTRPWVLLSRFQGNERDGHGNHSAAGLLSQQAAKLAGDPSEFPEQIAEGLRPWTPFKVYMGGVRANEPYTLRIDSGAHRPGRVVCVWQWRAPESHHTVADVLVERPTITLHSVHDSRQVFVHSVQGIFGEFPHATGRVLARQAKSLDPLQRKDVLLIGEGGEAANVGEEHRHVAMHGPHLVIGLCD